tara:strand:+ start:27 stop:485 length:459 start_codon:yes stop_codon:yes gene_type:complete
MDIRCPCCHATFALEQATEDEALREMMGILAELPREVSRPIVAYVGLFRGKTRATAYERQLRLAREVLAMHDDTQLVGVALSETVEAIRVKRDSGEDARPLRNHNYLKRVIESHQARGVGAVQVTRDTPSPARSTSSRTAAALAALGRRSRG